jgi:hypothetical protein
MNAITTDESVRDLREALLACIHHILELPPPASDFKQQHILGRARAAVAKADRLLAGFTELAPPSEHRMSLEG